MRPAVLIFCALLLSCASGPEPIKEPPLPPPNAMELFRRARFVELDKVAPDQVRRLFRTLRSPDLPLDEDFADRSARMTYRRGEVDATIDQIAMLPTKNRTRVILEALLSQVDLSRPIRESDHPRHSLELPLDSKALDKGYPLIRAEVNGKEVHLLWDTGAVENVLSPAAVEKFDLPTTAVEFVVRRQDDALVVRFAATGTKNLQIGPWGVSNMPWLVMELDRIEDTIRETRAIDGFLAPQLLIPWGCFSIDREKAILTIGFEPRSCKRIMSKAHNKTPLYTWDGEILVSARVAASPDVAVRVETGSPVTFLRANASRYLPTGMLRADPNERDGEIAHDLSQTVRLLVAGRAKAVSAIDLQPIRENAAYDDIATLGNDVLLQGRGLAVSFMTMELGTLNLGPEGTNPDQPKVADGK